ncbi:hypothetical protein AWZ03_006142 [Drosophila navojoa]|uniref:Uncharacterized protein n=1 Tax=Drosophila navojoa TaxID=7232 RepID=A0A484BFD8_DRONA|nr:hypothetical protein AWZ03_006142 [Drosophila navojoa]
MPRPLSHSHSQLQRSLRPLQQPLRLLVPLLLLNICLQHVAVVTADNLESKALHVHLQVSARLAFVNVSTVAGA